MELTTELIEKAKRVKTPEELFTLSKENNFQWGLEEATSIFERFNQKSGEIMDEELSNVVGGGCRNLRPANEADVRCEHYICNQCGYNSKMPETGGVKRCEQCTTDKPWGGTVPLSYKVCRGCVMLVTYKYSRYCIGPGRESN